MYQCFCHFVCQSFLQLFFQRFAQYLHAALQPLARLVGVVDADRVPSAVLERVEHIARNEDQVMASDWMTQKLRNNGKTIRGPSGSSGGSFV